MDPTFSDRTGHFCWVDLAAANETRACAFYRALFGWTARRHRVGNGRLTRLLLDRSDVGSMYQLGPQHLDNGVPSHWTPYVAVPDADAAADRARALGGGVVVEPIDIPGMARVALVLDPVGALFGLWQGGGHGPQATATDADPPEA